MKNMKNQRKQRKSSTKHTYIIGNVVRQLEPMVEIAPKRQVRRTRANVTKRVLGIATARMSQAYFYIFTLASIFTLFMFYRYISIRTEVTYGASNIANLEKKLQTLKTQNDAVETSLNSYIDLQKVYEKATQEYGMVHANKDQVIIYKKNESEYIQQNDEIPRQ